MEKILCIKAAKTRGGKSHCSKRRRAAILVIEISGPYRFWPCHPTEPLKLKPDVFLDENILLWQVLMQSKISLYLSHLLMYQLVKTLTA